MALYPKILSNIRLFDEKTKVLV